MHLLYIIFIAYFYAFNQSLAAIFYQLPTSFSPTLFSNPLPRSAIQHCHQLLFAILIYYTLSFPHCSSCSPASFHFHLLEFQALFAKSQSVKRVCRQCLRAFPVTYCFSFCRFWRFRWNAFFTRSSKKAARSIDKVPELFLAVAVLVVVVVATMFKSSSAIIIPRKYFSLFFL